LLSPVAYTPHPPPPLPRAQAVRIVAHAFEIVHLLTDQNPIQVLVDAIVNTGPREDSTRIGSQGTVRRQAVDVSPLRRVNQAVSLITIGVRESSFRNVKSISECRASSSPSSSSRRSLQGHELTSCTGRGRSCRRAHQRRQGLVELVRHQEEGVRPRSPCLAHGPLPGSSLTLPLPFPPAASSSVSPSRTGKRLAAFACHASCRSEGGAGEGKLEFGRRSRRSGRAGLKRMYLSLPGVSSPCLYWSLSFLLPLSLVLRRARREESARLAKARARPFFLGSLGSSLSLEEELTKHGGTAQQELEPKRTALPRRRSHLVLASLLVRAVLLRLLLLLLALGLLLFLLKHLGLLLLRTRAPGLSVNARSRRGRVRADAAEGGRADAPSTSS